MSYLQEAERRVAAAREAQPGTIAWEARRAECFAFMPALLEIVQAMAREVTLLGYCPLCEAFTETAGHQEGCLMAEVMRDHPGQSD